MLPFVSVVLPAPYIRLSILHSVLALVFRPRMETMAGRISALPSNVSSILFKPKVRLIGLVEAIAVLSVLLFFLGFFGRYYWALDLCSHFRAQYGAGLLICGLGLFVAGRRRSGLASFAGGLLISATFLPVRPMPDSAGAPVLKVITYNVNTGNDRHREVCGYLENEDADIVLLTEVDREWLSDLSSLNARYPHRIEVPRSDNFGMALFSKTAFIHQRVRTSGPYNLPWIEADVHWDGHPVRLIGLHPLPPVSGQDSASRNEQLMEAADLLADRPGILLGDLNLTPYSSWFPEILSRGHLVDTGANTGFSPTWSPYSPLLGIPIDHVLTGRGLAPVRRMVGPTMGSDHHPLIVQIAPMRR